MGKKRENVSINFWSHSVSLLLHATPEAPASVVLLSGSLPTVALASFGASSSSWQITAMGQSSLRYCYVIETRSETFMAFMAKAKHTWEGRLLILWDFMRSRWKNNEVESDQTGNQHFRLHYFNWLQKSKLLQNATVEQLGPNITNRFVTLWDVFTLSCSLCTQWCL